MMRPGGTQLTVMPCLPTSRDRPLAHECTAALAAKAPFSPSGSDLPVMLIMRPHLRAIICGSSRCVSCRWRRKLSVSASSHCSSDDSSVKRRLPPALLIRMSTPPRPASALSAMRYGAWSARKSCSTMTIEVPASRCSSSSSARRRATTASVTPSRESESAMARPMPMLAPVTSARLPAMPRSISALELEDVHARVGAVDRVDVAAIVDVEVVGLDRDLAALGAGGVLDAPFVGLVRGRGNVIARFLRVVRIADVERAHAGVEPGDEHVLAVIHRRLVLVRRMRAETAAARAEVAARFRHRIGGDADRRFLVGRIDHPDHLPRLRAFVGERLVDDDDDVALAAVLVLGELRHLHAEHRQRRVGAVVGVELEAADF